MSLLEERALALVRRGGLSFGVHHDPQCPLISALCCAIAEEIERERNTRETRDWRGGRKLAMYICCLSVPSPTGSGNPHIRCTAAAVSSQALSNTYTMALLSQTKLE